MEKLIYESKPFLYGFIALVALYNGKGSILMTTSGVFMGLACIAIGMLRYDSRTQVAYGIVAKKGKASRDQIQGQTQYGQTKYHIE